MPPPAYWPPALDSQKMWQTANAHYKAPSLDLVMGVWRGKALSYSASAILSLVLLILGVERVSVAERAKVIVAIIGEVYVKIVAKETKGIV